MTVSKTLPVNSTPPGGRNEGILYRCWPRRPGTPDTKGQETTWTGRLLPLRRESGEQGDIEVCQARCKKAQHPQHEPGRAGKNLQKGQGQGGRRSPAPYGRPRPVWRYPGTDEGP